MIKKYIKILNYIEHRLNGDYKISYSQNGEDILISRIFRNLNITNIFYLDIGANHPKIYNNTYLLYLNGSSGICIEPNVTLCDKIKKNRPRDTVLNIAISDKTGTLTYFSFQSHLQNTFSEEESKKSIKQGNKLIETDPVKTKTLNDIFKDLPKMPDLVSLDIEGYDEIVLKNFDFTKNKPIVWCIETIERIGNSWSKNKSIIKYMEENGYLVYGDTNINTIFVEKESMKKINYIR